jgi:hypothetical protein
VRGLEEGTQASGAGFLLFVLSLSLSSLSSLSLSSVCSSTFIISILVHSGLGFLDSLTTWSHFTSSRAVVKRWLNAAIRRLKSRELATPHARSLSPPHRQHGLAALRARRARLLAPPVPVRFAVRERLRAQAAASLEPRELAAAGAVRAVPADVRRAGRGQCRVVLGLGASGSESDETAAGGVGRGVEGRGVVCCVPSSGGCLR